MDVLKKCIRPSLESAVSVIGGEHFYAEYTPTGVRRHQVLSDLNMDVSFGTIYALLGSSGCGKTTLLRAVVGQHRLTGGEVRVLGFRPARAGRGHGHSLPASLIGYMPQEEALPTALTIGEVLRFHGMLAGMAVGDVAARLPQLADGLGLPHANTIVATLSGGQRRRVSFAVALLSTPPLLILDEPTVGLDPLLRVRIWDTLLELTASQRTTILLTTHYVEEARQAHTVGVMRLGRIVAQESPASLVASVSSANLEDAVVQLCVQQEEDRRKQVDGEVPTPQRRRRRRSSGLARTPGARVHIPGLSGVLFAQRHLLALLWKHVIGVWRNKLGLAVLCTLTVLMPWITELVLADFPGVVLSVVNEDARCNATAPSEAPSDLACSPRATALSCLFLDILRHRAAKITTVECADLAEAEAMARAGRSWGLLLFQANFSGALVERVLLSDPRSIADEALDASDVIAQLDMSNAVTSNMIVRKLSEATRMLTSALSCSTGLGASELLRVHEPVYGLAEATLATDQRPTMILAPMYLFAGILGLKALMSEREEQTVERGLVAGVTKLSLLVSVVVVYLPIVLAQVGLHMLVVFVVMGTPCLGPTLPVFCITAIFSVFSFLFGLICATAAKSFAVGGMMVQTGFLTLVFLSGAVWPIEGLHWSLRWLAAVVPMEAPALALRAVLVRGWGLAQLQVRAGVTVALASCAVAAGVLAVWACWAALPYRSRPTCWRTSDNFQSDIKPT